MAFYTPRMPRLSLVLCSLVAVISGTPKSFGQVKTPGAEWERVSSFQFNWNKRGIASFTLEIPKAWAGPGDFTRIRIQVPGQKPLVLTNADGWVKYDPSSADLSHGLLTRNLLHSRYVLAVRANGNRILLFLFGYAYASSPGSLDALELSRDGEPKVVLHRDTLGLEEVRDLDGDGLVEIVGYPCLAELWGNGLETYAPFNVFKLARLPGGRATLSVSLSKDYNLKNYFGWAGPSCSEKYSVVLHPPHGGRPFITTAKEAQEIAEEPR